MRAWFSSWTPKDLLALSVSFFVILGTMLICIWGFGYVNGVLEPKDKLEGLRFIATTLLPLWGTWIGTILAYYFSKENFEAATRGISSIIKQVTPANALESFNVEKEMIPLSQITRFARAAPGTEIDDNITMKEVFDFIESHKSIGRIPFITKDDKLKYIIHVSTFNRYKVSFKSGDDFMSSTLGKMKESSDMKPFFDNGAQFINKNSSLKEVQEILNKFPKVCQDVFVTDTGNKDEVLLGWVTDTAIINKLLK